MLELKEGERIMEPKTAWEEDAELIGMIKGKIEGKIEARSNLSTSILRRNSARKVESYKVELRS